MRRRGWLAVAGVLLAILAVIALRLWRAATFAAANGSLAGAIAPESCDGKIAAPPGGYPHLVSYSITPSKEIRVGQTLHVMARTDCPVSVGTPVVVYSTFETNTTLDLYDDGNHGDKVAGDGTWTLDLPWREEYGAGQGVWLQVGIKAPDNGLCQWTWPIPLAVAPAQPTAPARRKLWPW